MVIKIRKLGFSVALLSVFLIGCNSEDSSENEELTPTELTTEAPSWVSISEGIWGNVLFWEGDFMPGSSQPGTKTSVERTIYIFETTLESQTSRIGYSTFFEHVNTQLVLVVYSDEDGTFQAQLPPGDYSVFILEDGTLWANSMERNYETGAFTINPVTVEEDKVIEFNIDINYAASY